MSHKQADTPTHAHTTHASGRTKVQKEGRTGKWNEKRTAGRRRDEWTEVKGT